MNEDPDTTISTLPKALHVEITTCCNANCIICPRNKMKRVDKEMPLTDILAVVEQAWDMGVREVHPHLFGEPTIHPQFVELLYKLQEKFEDIKIYSFTNGSKLLDSDLRKAYLDTCYRIMISMDGVRSCIMKKTRPGLNPVKVRKGTKLLLKECGVRRVPRIFAGMVKMPETEGEEELFKRVWKGCTGVRVQPLIHFCDDGLTSVEQRQHTEAIHHRCDRPFERIVVSVEKDVILCCSDFNASVVLGNLNDDLLSDIWDGEVAANIRRLHCEGKAKEIPLCALCGYFHFL